MTFALPTFPAPSKAPPRLISASIDSDGPLGAPDTRYLGLGSRFAMDVSLPPMEYDDARLWVAALIRAEREECTMEFGQPGLTIGNPGAPKISATVSANATVLPIKDLAGGYTILGGQFFNVVKGGRRYLHAAVQTGTTPLLIGPALRLPLADNDPLDFATPQIQGLIKGPEFGWDVDVAHHYGVSFTIKERC